MFGIEFRIPRAVRRLFGNPFFGATVDIARAAAKVAARQQIADSANVIRRTRGQDPTAIAELERLASARVEKAIDDVFGELLGK